MAETSYPIQESPLGIDQWKSLMLPLGRGIIDRGGYPYRLVSRDSVTDTVTIGVPSTAPQRSEAILDGFLHSMDTPKAVSVPPVSTNTTYEVGLVYDPTNQADPNGPVTLTSWVAPGDNSGGKSRLVLFRFERKPNVALGSTTYTDERPRVSPVISVSKESQLPVNGMVLVDTLAVVRTTGTIFRADINDAGVVSWSPTAGNDVSAEISAAINAALGTGWKQATPYATGDSIVRRWPDGVIRVGDSINHPQDALNLRSADGRYMRQGDGILGGWILKDENNPIPWEVVQGSTKAYKETNLGSTWATVAVNSAGRFGRYPSALKYKQNIREWDIDPETVVNMTPVKYDLRPEAGESDDGSTDKGLIGFVADAYVNTVRELVQKVDGEVEGFHYQLMPVAQQVVLRWHEKRVKALEAENDVLRHNLTEVLALLGLNTDDTGRVITTDGNN